MMRRRARRRRRCCAGAHGCRLPCGLVAGAAIPPLCAQAPDRLQTASSTASTISRRGKRRRSDGVQATIGPADGIAGRALRLDFDLGGTAGYAIARTRAAARLCRRTTSSRSGVRGDAPSNDLQFKLVDASGDNVWWFNRRNFEFPREWRQIRIRKRADRLRLGADRRSRAAPRGAARARRRGRARRRHGIASISATSSCASCRRSLRRWPTPLARASSQLRGAAPQLALDGNAATAWQSDPAAGPEQTLTIDFGSRARVRRPDRALAEPRVRVALRRAVFRRRRALADRAHRHRRPRRPRRAAAAPMRRRDSSALALRDGPAQAYAHRRNRGRRISRSARRPTRSSKRSRGDAPRGAYPRGFSGEQTYWTVVGVDGGRDSGAPLRGRRARGRERAASRSSRFVVDGTQRHDLGRRRDDAVAGRRLPADCRASRGGARDLAPAA